MYTYYVFKKKPSIVNKIIKKELPKLPNKYYFWLGLYINNKYIIKLTNVKTYVYVLYLRQLSHKLKHNNLHNLHDVYKYALKKGLLNDFDKNYKIIAKNAGNIFKIIKKMYKKCLDNKQYVKYIENEGKYTDFPSNINYYLDRLPEYSDRDFIEREVKKKLSLK